MIGTPAAIWIPTVLVQPETYGGTELELRDTWSSAPVEGGVRFVRGTHFDAVLEALKGMVLLEPWRDCANMRAARAAIAKAEGKDAPQT